MFLTMENRFLFVSLLAFLPSLKCQTAEEVLEGIEQLNKANAAFRQPDSYAEYDHSPFNYAGNYGTYDFIIVGAGSAGTVLANRLSEVAHWNILLLEAGGNDNVYTDIPYLVGLLQFTDFNWGFRSTPQKTGCLGMENNECNVPRGKGLGGSSTINFMIYTRGNRADYDQWAKDGNVGWSYNEILPYFLKSENTSLTDPVDEPYHSNKGSLHVEHIPYFTPVAQAFLDANKDIGRKILDYNGRDQMGYSMIQANMIDGKRCSGNKAFLQPVLKRKNLTVLTGAFVTKLLIQKSNRTGVWAVEFVLGNKKYYAENNFDVILAAGAIASPQILMHSGIGPKYHLQSLGIDVVADLPVGRNLHDHPVLLYPYSTNFTDLGVQPIEKMVGEYVNGQGFLTTAGNMQDIGYINYLDPSSSVPDIEQVLVPYFGLGDGFLAKLFNYKNVTYEAYTKPFNQYDVMAMLVLLHPKSRGSITLKSNNLFDHPNIDLNIFDDPDDVEMMVNAFNDFLALTKTESMKKFNISIEHNPIPECPQEFLSLDYLRCLVRHMTTSMYHLGGTCKMGPSHYPEAVVDPRLKVKGVSNLRVIDASVIPRPISGHPNAAIYMIAEKGSDMIKQDYYYTTLRTQLYYCTINIL